MGTRFGNYELLEPLASGGMARVFRAKMTGAEGFEKIVALKFMLPSLASEPGLVEMFIDEARIAATLTHANIVGILDFGESDGEYFICMEYVSGANLRVLTRRSLETRQRMSPPMAAWIVAEIARGLDHAHNRTDSHGEPLGIVHRDISPQNLVVSWNGEVKILDFGIARSRDKTFQTVAGTIKGKYAYMSPEQAAGAPLDHRSDLFALGAVLYELLTGEKAFPQVLVADVVAKVLVADYAPPVGVPPALAEVVRRAMARKPRDRFPSAAAMLEPLQRYLAEDRARMGGSTADGQALAAWAQRLFSVPEAGGRQETATGSFATLTFSGSDESAPGDEATLLAAGMLRIAPAARPASEAAETVVKEALPPGSAPQDETVAKRAPPPVAPRVWVDAEPTATGLEDFAGPALLPAVKRASLSGPASLLLFLAGAVGAAAATLLVSSFLQRPGTPAPTPTPARTPFPIIGHEMLP